MCKKIPMVQKNVGEFQNWNSPSATTLVKKAMTPDRRLGSVCRILQSIPIQTESLSDLK